MAKTWTKSPSEYDGTRLVDFVQNPSKLCAPFPVFLWVIYVFAK